ncbi:MAG: FGGY family carbohydrate kinase [Bacteroidia bacterium]|nr:FGGY family carbohydrate kinase [Bacteroidia bacterium]
MNVPVVKRYISIDLATDHGEVVLVTFTDGKPALETVHSFPVRTVEMAGKTFWNIYSIYDEVIEGLAIIGSRRIQIESIGIDSWSCDFVCIAKDGTIIGLPRCSETAYAASSQAKFFKKKISASEYYEVSGVQLRDSLTAFQMFAQRKEKNKALDFARSILFISDALAYMLTGKKASNSVQLSAAGFVNASSGKIYKDAVKASHVKPKRIPYVISPASKLSRISEEVAARTGLDRINVVAVAASATASSVYSLPLEEEGSAFLYLGRTAYMGVEVPSPVVNARTAGLNLSNERTAGGKFLMLKYFPGMELLEDCKEVWAEEGKDCSKESLAAMLGQSLQSVALLDMEDARLIRQANAPAAIAKYCSLKEMKAPQDDASLLRLIYDSLAEKCADILRKLQGVSPFRIKSLCVTGPYASDAFLNRLIANDCGMDVIAVQGNAAALGNAAVQAGRTRANLVEYIETDTFKPEMS